PAAGGRRAPAGRARPARGARAPPPPEAAAKEAFSDATKAASFAAAGALALGLIATLTLRSRPVERVESPRIE
ncbi:hypothetical protein, partial [Pseudolysinimonas sp.]|uniref:hypothetical protein n=1 Tax=Pseudolysinimonas sp. TaxID=2680009 RepID=UPI003F7DC693